MNLIVSNVYLTQLAADDNMPGVGSLFTGRVGYNFQDGLLASFWVITKKTRWGKVHYSLGGWGIIFRVGFLLRFGLSRKDKVG